MGQTFSQLTTPNSELASPNGQTFIGSPQQVLSRANAALPSVSSMVGTDVLNPESNPGAVDNLPQIKTPSFLQAATGPTGMPNATSPGLSKLGKLVTLFRGGLEGGLAAQQAQEQMIAQSGGHRAGGVGTGFEAGYQLPFLRAIQQQQVAKGQAETSVAQQTAKFFPQTQMLNIGKSLSDINKSNAEAGKANAEAAGQKYVDALHEASAAADRYKESNGVLYDVSGATPQPVNGVAGQFIPADQQMAQLANVPVGTQLPVATAQKLRQMANEGIRTVQANGRSLLVDNQGKTIKDLGTASNVVSFNLQNAGLNGQNGQASSIAQSIANGSMRWQDAVSPRTPMQVKESLLREVKSLNPNFNSGDFDVEKRVREKFTSGNVSDQLMAISTAREHMKTFGRLADALDNSDWQLANRIGNTLGVQFGSDKATNLQIAAQAFGGEVGRAFDGAGVTAGERQKAESAYADYLSKGQFKGAIRIVDELLAGKQRSAKQTYDTGRSGQPNFGGNQQNDFFSQFGGTSR